MLPNAAQVERRLQQMLLKDSAQTGIQARTDRLMLMLTRSCELRCSYCFVALQETYYQQPHQGQWADGRPAGDMPLWVAQRAIDRLMGSKKQRLGLQFFGGEPSRRWDVLRTALQYAVDHPKRQGRELELLFTTNGLGLDAERLASLQGLPVVIQLSVDGIGTANRFRRALNGQAMETAWMHSITLLKQSGLQWFLNVTLPPKAAGEVVQRYQDARQLQAPALQINYATGLYWSPEQATAYLQGLIDILRMDRASPGVIQLFNRQHAADPAPLCGDVICDVDGSLLQVGGIFHERRFPALRAAYLHGHIEDEGSFAQSRATLSELWRRTQQALSREEAEIFANGMRLGAAADIVGRLVMAEARP